MANINSVITYNANLSPAQAQIRALTGQIAGLTAAFNTLNKTATATQRRLASAFAADVGNIGGFTTQMVTAQNAVETFGKQLATNRLTMREYFREAVVGYTKQNSLMQQLAERQVRYQQSVAVPVGAGQTMMLTPQTLATTGNAAALASAKFAVFNKLIDGGATAMLNWGKNTQWAGRQLMVGFTVPLAMFTALASKQFRDLDKELTRFQKVYGSDLGGAMTDATARMRDQVQALAYDISKAYGIAAKDTAALAADIAATGQEGQALLESVQQTTRLAVLGEVDRQEAMKATLSLQSAFRMNTDELAESINFLNAVENQTSATLEDLATAIPKVGPVVRSLGGDVKDLATLLVAMREGGIPAAEAANALKSGLASLINPTKQASEVAKKFGVDLVGIVDANQGKLMPTIFAMKEALAGLDSFARAQIIEQIFGKYQFARITALFDNIGRMGSQTQAVIELASKSTGELAAIANGEIKTLTESTAVKFQRTMEELKNAIMPIGQTLTETLIPILSFIGDGIKAFSGFFANLPGPIKDFAKLGVAIAALAGPIIMLVGLFGNLIANGVKFGMMVTRLGARMMGIKVQPFELLNAELMAAKLGVDNLTGSFTSQEAAMRRLVGTLIAYEDSLKRIRVAQPQLFIPNTMPGPAGRTPVRRQHGGPIPGYGGGDIVPAYLEPGEFVITKEATRENRAFLEAINSGQEPGKHKRGRSSAYSSGQSDIERASKLHTVSPSELGRMAYGPTSKTMLGVVGYGGFTSTLHPQYINNTFDKLKDLPSWMRAGVPYNDRAAAQMLKKLLEEQVKRGGKVGPEFIKSIQYLQDLVNNPGKAKELTLKGYAATTAAAERFAGVIPNDDKEQDRRTKQLYSALTRKVGSATSPGRIFNVLNQMTMQYIDEALADPRRRHLVWQSTKGASSSQFKDSLRILGGKRLPPWAQSGVLSRYVRIGRLQDGGVGQGEPALLEPGEFVVNSEASRRNANILHAMNKGTIKGYQFGRSQNLPGETTLPSGLVVPGSAAPAAAGGADETVKAHLNRPITVPASSLLGLQGLTDSARASLLAITANGDVLVRVFSNLVVALQKTTNTALNTGNAMASTVSAELKSAAAWEIITRNTGLTMQDLQPTILRVTAELDNLGNELIDDPRLYQIVETELTQLAAAGDRAAIVLQTLGSQYGAMADPNDPRKHRMDLGAGIAPSYRTGRTGTGTPVHMLPYVDLRQYAVDPVTGARRALPMAAAETTGPNRAMQDPMAKMMRGQGLMNVAFMGSMLVSTFAMAGAASEDLAAKLSMLSMAIMALPMLQMLNPRGMATNFLGLGSLGKTLAEKGAAKQAAVAGAAPIGTRFVPNSAQAIAAGGPKFLPFGSTAGSGLLTAGRIASLAGGPVGIGVATAITGVVAAYMLYKNAADEARERAIASFEDPAKSAEYFGETIDDLGKELEDRKLRFSPLADLSEVDQGLRDIVKEEYAPLIERVKYATASDGARELALAYNNMIVNGLSAENAKETLRAIAVEAGTQGGLAYGEAFVSGMTGAENVEDAIQKQLDLLNPEKNKQLIERLQQSIPQLESQAFDAMNADAASRWKQLGIGFAQLGGIDWQKQTSGLTDFQGKFEVMTRGLTNVWEGFTGQLFDSTPEAQAADAAANMVEQTEDSINNLKQLSADAFAASTEGFMKAYEDAPQKVIEAIQASSMWLDASTENVDLLKQKLMELNPILAGLIAMLQNPEEISLFYQLMTVGADPTRFFDENGFNKAAAEQTIATIAHYDQLRKNSEETFDELKENTIKFIDEEIKATNKGIRKVNDYWDSWAKVTRKEQRQAQKDYDQAQRRSEKFIETKQDEIEAIQDSIDERRDAFEERMRGYEDERKAIEDSSDAYIKSLQKNQEADSFYAQQRKTSLSALEKLAGGDVFGFLQEREQMSADAQQFSYDQMISGIEDRRDAELKVIEDTMEAERRRQDDWEEAQSEKIEGINDLIDAENELMDQRTKNHEKEMRQFEKRQKTIEINRRQDLKDDKEKLRTLQTAREDAETLELADYEKMTELLGKAYEDRYGKQIIELQKTQYYIRLNDLLERNANADVSKRLSETQLKIAAFTQAFGQKPRAKVSIDEQLAAMGMFPYGPGQGGQAAPGIATGGYINNGKVEVQRFDDGGGGNVVGPGGPKSDVIPALLSNGEYVIRASSVKQYGKDMMDNINEGKFANGGIVGYKNGTSNPTWYSADRAEQNATGTRYTRPAPSVTPTPNWNPAQYRLPEQRYGPYGVGRIPQTTKPFVAPQIGRTADLATMLSPGYSHKMNPYGTTLDYQQFLMNKSGTTYVPGYGYVGQKIEGGRKWQSLMESMLVPGGVGSAVSDRLQPLLRDMPNLDFWRSLSREQKKFVFNYSTMGKLNNWTNEKVFRLMPSLPAIPTSRLNPAEDQYRPSFKTSRLWANMDPVSYPIPWPLSMPEDYLEDKNPYPLYPGRPEGNVGNDIPPPPLAQQVWERFMSWITSGSAPKLMPMPGRGAGWMGPYSYANGGYTSADRAEYAASNRPTYYGGTPTSTTGYQSPKSPSKNKPTYSGPRFFNNYSSETLERLALPLEQSKVGAGTPGYFGSMFIDFGKSMGSGLVDFLGVMGLSSFTGIGSPQNLGNNAGAAAIGGEQYAQSSLEEKALNAGLAGLTLLPTGTFGTLGRTLIGKPLGSLGYRLGATRAIRSAQNINANYAGLKIHESKIIDQLIRAGDNPYGSKVPGIQIKNYVPDEYLNLPKGVSGSELFGSFLNQYVYTQEAKTAAARIAASQGPKPIRIVTDQQANAAREIARELQSTGQIDPSNLLSFKTLSANDQAAVKEILQAAEGNIDNIPYGGGWDSLVWNQGQINVVEEGGFLKALGLMAHESGHTLDISLLGTRGSTGFFSAAGLPFTEVRQSLSGLETGTPFARMPSPQQRGIQEAYAEASRVSALSKLLEDAGISPQNWLIPGGAGVRPYYTGMYLSGNQLGYGSSPQFKMAYAKAMRMLLEGKSSSPQFNPKNFSMKGTGITKDIIRTIPEYYLAKLKYMQEYANGGIVRKFGVGGTADNQERNSTSQNQGGNPITNAYEAKEARAGIYGGHHEYSYSQNGWPYLPGYTAGELQSGTIPGTNVSISTHKDVLPLFLAIGQLYNSRIRRIDQSQTAGFGFRDNQTNHRSGTALDINWAEEGQLSDAQYMYDWWSGKPNPAANWPKLSSNPARSAIEIRNFFNQFGEIIEWYGSSKLGGDLISGQGYTADWMHWQISQRTKPSPGRVKEVMVRLGITEEGRTNINPATETTTSKNNSNDPVSIEGNRIMPSRGLLGILSMVQDSGQVDVKGSKETNYTPNSTPSSTAQGALNYAIEQIGKPYSLNAQPPDSWDCSKLTSWAWNEAAGKNILTPYSHTQATELTQRVRGLKNGEISGLSIGDVLYFNTEGDTGGHTSLYAGNNKVIQASSPSTGVIRSDLNSPWNTGINPKTGKPRFQWAGPPKGFAMGGLISGPGGPRSDMIPAMLSNGEYVVKAASVQKYGKGFMDRLNAGAVDFSNAKQFSDGGFTKFSPKIYLAGGGMAGSMPSFSMPQMSPASPSELGTNINNIGGTNTSSTSTSNKINIVINGAGNKSANAIANKVISMINNANERRDHSRSIG